VDGGGEGGGGGGGGVTGRRGGGGGGGDRGVLRDWGDGEGKGWGGQEGGIGGGGGGRGSCCLRDLWWCCFLSSPSFKQGLERARSLAGRVNLTYRKVNLHSCYGRTLRGQGN